MNRPPEVEETAAPGTGCLRADLSGRTAFITGASRGFGAHFARVLAVAGCTVVLAARRRAALESVAAQIAALGGRAVPVVLDVVDAASVRAAVAEATRELGAIDVAVNCAGIIETGVLLDCGEREWDAVLDTNLKGAFLVGAEVARAMRAAGRGGSIINIGSILAERQRGGLASYAVSKAGLVQLTKVMALEWARYGIRVNAILPGYFETEINRDFWNTPAATEMLKRVPQRRAGRLADLDGPLLLLASPSSAFMTGSTLTVDGGHLLSSL